MPKRKATTDDADTTVVSVADHFYDTLRGAGCYKVDSVRRKNGGYELTTWVTPIRGLILIKATDAGRISYFEEISEDQLLEHIGQQ